MRTIPGVMQKNPELKALDTGYINGAGLVIDNITGNGTSQCLNNIAQGDDVNQRVGRQVRIKSLHIRGTLDYPAVDRPTINIPDANVRFMVVLDTQCNGPGEITINQLLNSGTQGVLAYNELNWRQRFVVLVDKHYVIPGSWVPAGGGQTALSPKIKVNKRCNIITTYNGAGGASTNITTNALWAFFVSDDLLPAISIQFVGAFRTRFIDN